jgi:hypothetical protein
MTVFLVDRCASGITEVQARLTYLGDTAGASPDTEFFALGESTPVREAIDAIQQAKDVEMIFISTSSTATHAGGGPLRQLRCRRATRRGRDHEPLGDQGAHRHRPERWRSWRRATTC